MQLKFRPWNYSDMLSTRSYKGSSKDIKTTFKVDPDLEIFHTGKLGYRVEVHEDKNMAQLDLQERCSSTAI